MKNKILTEKIILYKHKREDTYLYVYDNYVYYLSNDINKSGSSPHHNYFSQETVKKALDAYEYVIKITHTKYSWYYGEISRFWRTYSRHYHKKDYYLIDTNVKLKKIKFV